MFVAKGRAGATHPPKWLSLGRYIVFGIFAITDFIAIRDFAIRYITIKRLLCALVFVLSSGNRRGEVTHDIATNRELDYGNP